MAGTRGLRRMKGQAQHLGGLRCQDGGPIAHRGYAIEMRSAGLQGLERFRNVIKADRDGMVAPRIVKDMTAVGRKCEAQTQPAAGLGEYPGLIPRGRGKE